ncbi:MAG TPA: hypothetical protein VM118_12590 [Acidobacteriota bacterium]|nr:hypothetical protein [Acidobacteriota bacterium]
MPDRAGTPEFSLGPPRPIPYLRRMARERKGPKKAKGPASRIHKPEKPKKTHRGFLSPFIARHPVRWAILGYASFVLIIFAGSIFSPGEMVYGTDTMSAGVFFRSFHAEQWRTHLSMPMWNPYIHAGLPFVDAMHGDIFYPAAILQIILPVTYALGMKLFLHIFLAGIFMFLFLRAIGRSDTASFIGGILYMFSPCLVSLIYPGHDGKIYVTALTPLAFLALYRAVISRRLVAFLGFGLAYAAMILTAHVQMAYYAAWGLGLYFIFLAWDKYRLRLRQVIPLVLSFTVAVLLALGATSMQWMAPYKYTNKYSQRLAHQEEEQRGFEWSSSWSMNSEELLSEINPEFPGSNLISDPRPTYWGQNYFKLNSEAVGVMVLALAIVALVAVPGPTMWFFGGLSLIALLYAMGSSTPVFRLFYELVPMVKKFRAPSMICFLFAFSWVVMAARGLDVLRAPAPVVGPKRKPAPDPFRVLLIIAAVYLGITLIAIAAGSSLLTGWASIVGNPLDPQKQAAAMANAGNVRNGFLIWSVVLWGLVATFYFRRRGILPAVTVVVILAHLAGLPLIKFDKRFVETVDPRPIYGERPILNLIRQHAPDEPYRVLNIRGTGAQGDLEDNYLALHGIEELSPTAMHGNHLLTHDIFVGRHDSQPALLTNATTRNLMNARLVVSRRPLQQEGFTALGESGGFYLYNNDDAMPRAAVFYQYEVEPDTNATLERIRSDDFPYRSRVILDQALPDREPVKADAAPIPFSPARVIEWDTDRFVVECSVARDGLLWLSENYYPAWRATDETGRTLPIYRADYTFRAVPVTAGTHRITFAYHSATFANSVWLSLVCLLILLGGTVAALRSRPQIMTVEPIPVPTTEA